MHLISTLNYILYIHENLISVCLLFNNFQSKQNLLYNHVPIGYFLSSSLWYNYLS